MKTSARHVLLCCLATGGALSLGACGKHENNAPAPAPASTTAAPAVPVHPAPAPAHTAPVPATSASSAAPASAGSSAPAAAGTTAAATPAADDAFAIGQVLIGDAVNAEHAVTAPKDSIAADHKAIYASVESRGKTDGVTLSARWSYLEGKGQLVSAISQSIATDGPAVTTFKIQNPHLWPAGKYQVEIALDGKPVSTRSFEVKSPG